MKASSKIKTVTGVMMVVVMVGLTACGKKEAAETQSTKDDISNYYQEELELDEESADELAEIAMEINDIEDSEGAEEEAEAAEAEEMEPINSCFDEAIDNCFSYYSTYHKLNLDKSVLFMTEDEIVEAIGKPDSKQNGWLYWKTDGEHLFFDEPNYDVYECYPCFHLTPAEYTDDGQLYSLSQFYGFYQEMDDSVTDTWYNDTYDLNKYYEGIPASPWSFFEEFLLNEDGSLAYDAEQVIDWKYDDYVQALGSKGIMVNTGYKAEWDSPNTPTITIAWYFPADGSEHRYGNNDSISNISKEDESVVIEVQFNSQTGENMEKYAPSFRVSSLKDYSSTEQP
ncbi:MAG: hypothetical protein K6G12_00670 [Lachnospiraceae bacterium]|nr:hypothetical protein [Lachnospiraceae bacterium]